MLESHPVVHALCKRRVSELYAIAAMKTSSLVHGSRQNVHLGRECDIDPSRRAQSWQDVSVYVNCRKNLNPSRAVNRDFSER